MDFNLSYRQLTVGGVVGLLLILPLGVSAQVVDSTQVKPELNTLPPDRPALEPVPQLPTSPTPAPSRPAPAAPAPAPAPAPGGGFQPARPPQPNAQPGPARNSAVDAGTPVAPPTVTPEPPPARWFVEGNPDIGFGGSDDFTYFSLGLSAYLGYRISDRLAIGPGAVYQYTSFGPYKFSNVGGRVFGQFVIAENFFLHGEHEVLLAEVPVQLFSATSHQYLGLAKEKTTLNSTFLGIGYRSRLGQRFALDIMALYNFDRDTNYFIYSQPELRFNLLFDLF